MNPERWAAIELLYHGALARPEADRGAYLEAACANDPLLLAEINALLDASPTLTGFLERPPSQGASPATLASAAPMAIGQRLGNFELTELLGVGGMGQVYRAHDSVLRRDVAIKILPQAFTNHPDRLRRFTREAHILASLNHPHIAAIHSVEASGSVHALVLELVEGETLADRLARGRSQSGLPVDEALRIARQIADALEAAHHKGIIHRDLKPGNVMLRSDGFVKVLDFGLAKATEVSGSESSPSLTAEIDVTRAGVILGTPAYMSPEQARGHAVDTRTDVWAFGCLLYEMLTGATAFGGPNDTVSDTLAAVLRQEPDWTRLPTAAFPVRSLIARCVKKDPRQRLQAIGDARIQIEELTTTTTAESTVPSPSSRASFAQRAALVAGGVAVGAFVTALFSGVLRPVAPSPATTSRFPIVPPSSRALNIIPAARNIAISPDGRRVVYRAGPMAQLVVREVGSLEERVLPATANAQWPFFSPDGEWLGFFDGTSLKKVALGSGTVVTICENPFPPRGATWADDNTIVFANQNAHTGLLRVSATGGIPAMLTKPDPEEQEHWLPSLVPGGRYLLFTLAVRGRPDLAQVAVLDLTSGDWKPLLRGGHAEYLNTGHMVYVLAGVLYAVGFDRERAVIVGDALPIMNGIRNSSTAGDFAISRSGTLLVVPADTAQPSRTLAWIDRKGQETPIDLPPRVYRELRLSPDGRRVVLGIGDQENDIWIYDLSGGTLRRLTFGPSVDQRPVWTADGEHIVFASTRDGGGLFRQAANGTGEPQRLTDGRRMLYPNATTPDGTIFGYELSPATNGDIARIQLPDVPSASGSDLQLGVGSLTSQLLVNTPFIEINPEIAPNGRYLAYQSNESGTEQIYVRPLPRVSEGLWQVSTEGGRAAAWSRTGQELFYLDTANLLTSVSIRQSGETFAVGTSRRLLDRPFVTQPGNPRPYDVAPDGQRFLVIKDDRSASANMVITLNWFEELKTKLPATPR